MIRAGSCIELIGRVLERYGLECVAISAGESIPGSYWGDSEAGLIGSRLFFRSDTPLHSILHEAGHFICMSGERRARLVGDAGGDHDEENAVCYLQIVLADEFPGVGRQIMCQDMDAWGYTFRLGSAKAWFEHEAQDARQWLLAQGVLDAGGAPTWRRRD